MTRSKLVDALNSGTATAAALIAKNPAPQPSVDTAIVDAADLLTHRYQEPRFVVTHLVLEGGITVISGDTGSGKTAFLLDLGVSVAIGRDVAQRFEVAHQCRPVLYLNGEMRAAVLQQYLHRAVARHSGGVPRGRIVFEGGHGMASFRFNDNGRGQLEAVVDRIRPSVVIFDTQRALFEIDENDAADVRRMFNWIRSLGDRFGTAAIVAHHLRKIGPVSNTDRERVSGSRDIVAAADIHLALRSRSGRPLHALYIDKTRAPFGGVATGTEWPIEARIEPSNPPHSVIVAGDPTSHEANVENAEDELIALLEAEGPQTIAAMGADKGTRKRAYEALRERGSVVAVGKDGRKTMFGLVGVHDTEPSSDANAVNPDRTRDRIREKPSNDADSNAVNPDRGQDRKGASRAEDVSRASQRDRVSAPSTDDFDRERGQRSAYIDRDRDRVRRNGAEDRSNDDLLAYGDELLGGGVASDG